MVSISSKHLREVSDPVGELLTQLHKIVYLAKVRTDGHFIDRGSIYTCSLLFQYPETHVVSSYT